MGPRAALTGAARPRQPGPRAPRSVPFSPLPPCGARHRVLRPPALHGWATVSPPNCFSQAPPQGRVSALGHALGRLGTPLRDMPPPAIETGRFLPAADISRLPPGHHAGTAFGLEGKRTSGPAGVSTVSRWTPRPGPRGTVWGRGVRTCLRVCVRKRVCKALVRAQRGCLAAALGEGGACAMCPLPEGRL